MNLLKVKALGEHSLEISADSAQTTLRGLSRTYGANRTLKCFGSSQKSSDT